MKLCVAIVNNHDASGVSDALIEAGFGVTRLNSFGGFLQNGSVVLLIGTEDERLEELKEVIGSHSFKHKETAADASLAKRFGRSEKMTVSGATVFILKVNSFYQV